MSFYMFIKYTFGSLFKILYRIKVIDAYKIPKTKDKLIICANHVSLLDVLAIASIIDYPIRFIAKNELFTTKLTNWFFKKLGAFVKIIDGVEGLVHVSQISYEHVEKPSDELEIGDKIKVKILEINPENKRISLSIKATLEAPKKNESIIKKENFEKENIKYENEDLDNTIGNLLNL